MRHAWILIVLAACKQGTGDDYPINPGGDDTGNFHPQADAPMADQSTIDGDSMINARVCLLGDLRSPTCAATGAGGIGVTLGSSQAVTADDGSFSIISTGGTNQVWQIGGTGIVNALVPLSTSVLLPAVTTTYYDDMLSTNSVLLSPGQGSMVLFVRDAAGPIAGASVTLVPPAASAYPAMREASTSVDWEIGNTGASGASWTPGIVASTSGVKITTQGGAMQTISLPIADGAITFATVAF